MEICSRCAGRDVRAHARELTRVVGGRRFRGRIVVHRCEGCDWAPFPDVLAAFDRALAAKLALFGPACADSFAIMRRALDLDVDQAAAELGLTPRAVREAEKRPPVPLSAWLALAMIVRERSDDSWHAVQVVVEAAQPIPPRASLAKTTTVQDEDFPPVSRVTFRDSGEYAVALTRISRGRAS